MKNQRKRVDASYLEITDEGRLGQSKGSSFIKKVKTGDSSWYYLGFIGEIGFSITLPLVGGAILGSIIDRHWQIYPKATLSLLLLGLFVSIANLVRIIKEIIK